MPNQQQSTTTVIVNQPNAVSNARGWSSGICACCDDMESCCLVSFFPLCYLMCLYQRYNETCCTPCCVPMSDMALRIQHRNRHRIHGTVMNDCCMSVYCGLCSLCQVKRDMDYVEQTGGRLTL